MEPTNFRDPARWNSVPVPARVAERAYTKADLDEATGCWISQYSTASHGYSQIGWQEDGERHVVLGHRASWSHLNGQVPTGMTLDHICKNRRCVNPAHLRLLSNFENARRTNGEDWPVGSCRHGHGPEYIVLRTSTNKRGERYKKRVCQLCSRRWQNDYEDRRKRRDEEK